MVEGVQGFVEVDPALLARVGGTILDEVAVLVVVRERLQRHVVALRDRLEPPVEDAARQRGDGFLHSVGTERAGRGFQDTHC